MKFKKLNEEFLNEVSSVRADMYLKLVDFIRDRLENATDNLAIVASSEVAGYNADYCSDEPNMYSTKGYRCLEDAAKFFASFLTQNAPRDIIESLEDNDEDGWGEEINDKLHDMFDHVERFMYEIRNTVRGSYTRVDTVDELVDTIRNISAGFDAVADEIEDEEDSLQESLKNKNLNEDIDSTSFIGKPLKDFLKTIDHRTKISIESENGYDEYGGIGNVSGLGGLAHDAQWYLADKTIKDIQIPEDKRFYEYKILIEDLTDEVI